MTAAVEYRFHALPAWMFSNAYIDRLALRYRSTHSGLSDKDWPATDDICALIDHDFLIAKGVAKRRPTKTKTLTDVIVEQANASRHRVPSAAVIGHRLRCLRRFAGCPPQAFLDLAPGHGVAAKSANTTMSAYECGRRPIPFSLIQQWSIACGCSWRWFTQARFDDVQSGGIPSAWLPFAPPERRAQGLDIDAGQACSGVEIIADIRRQRRADLLAIVTLEKNLTDLHIVTGAPPWADPFIVLHAWRGGADAEGEAPLVTSETVPPAGVSPDAVWRGGRILMPSTTGTPRKSPGR